MITPYPARARGYTATVVSQHIVLIAACAQYENRKCNDVWCLNTETICAGHSCMQPHGAHLLNRTSHAHGDYAWWGRRLW